MTSANFYSGYATDKPTSKVLNPPGGRSNNIFGFAEEDSTTNNPNFRHKTQQQIDNINARQASTVFSDQHNRANGNQQQSKKRSGFNPITGESYDIEEPKPKLEEKKTEPEPVKQEQVKSEESNQQNAPPAKPIHTSSKVLQPPGGKSTKLW